MRTICLITAALFLVGCTGSGSPGGSVAPEGTPSSGGAGMGPGISVAEALASRLEGPLLINGWLWAEGAEVRLCAGLSESLPPQCATPSLTVSGLDLATVEGLRREGQTAWSQQTIQLLGEVSKGVLTVSALSKG